MDLLFSNAEKKKLKLIRRRVNCNCLLGVIAWRY